MSDLLLKPFAIGELVKWIVLGIVGIVLLIAFVAFSWEYVIPLIMVAVMGIFMIVSGVLKQKPMIGLSFLMLAFVLTWGIQKISVYQLSVFGLQGETSTIIGGLLGVFVVGIFLIVTLSTLVKGRR